MSKRYEELLTRMIHLYGMEDERVIGFAETLEKHPDDKANISYIFYKGLVESHEQLVQV